MNDPKKIEKLRRQGWEKMEVILVQRMQVNGSKFPWTWLVTSVSLILAVAIAFYIWKGNSSGSSDLEVEEAPFLIPLLERDSTKVLAPVGADSSARTYQEVVPPAGRNELLGREKMDDRVKTERFEREGRDFSNLRKDSIESNSKEMYLDLFTGTEVEETIESPILAPDSVEKRAFDSGHAVLKKISSLYFNSDSELPDMENWTYGIIPVKLPGKNRIRFLAFVQSYGSPRDRFMYLQFGPGMYYSTANWDFILKAGPSIPIPKNKHFFYLNDRFGNRYYPGRFEGDLQYSNEILQDYIYHEGYESKIGIMLSGSVGYRFHPNWNLSIETGFVISSYNFLVEAHSNPYFMTYAYLVDKSNNHFYSGLKLGYSLNRNLTLQAGITGLNLNKRKERAILPAVAIQFRF